VERKNSVGRSCFDLGFLYHIEFHSKPEDIERKVILKGKLVISLIIFKIDVTFTIIIEYVTIKSLLDFDQMIILNHINFEMTQ